MLFSLISLCGSCLTQLPPSRGGFRSVVQGLADVSMAAVGGWDVRNSHPGDALADACLLDHDLVRQVREGMNRIKIFRGYYDSRFGRNKAKVKGGDSGGKERMAPDPVHILTESEASNTSEAVKALRADVRYFKWIMVSLGIPPSFGVVRLILCYLKMDVLTHLKANDLIRPRSFWRPSMLATKLVALSALPSLRGCCTPPQLS